MNLLDERIDQYQSIANTIVQLIRRSTSVVIAPSQPTPTLKSGLDGCAVRLGNFHEEGRVDHNEAVRKFEHLMLRGAEQARETAIELEALVPLLTKEKSRQLVQLQVKASHKQAKDFRELAQKIKET